MRVRSRGGGYNDARLAAQVGEHGLEDSEVGDLSTLETWKTPVHQQPGHAVYEKKVTHAENRQLQPDNKHGLEGIVPGDVVENKADGKALEEVEEAEYDPVGQPLDVVMSRRGFEGLEGEIGRETPADKIGDGCSEGVDGVKNRNEEEGTEDSIGLGDLCALLEVLENWIFVEL